MSIPIELRNDIEDIVHDRFPGITVTWVDGGPDFIVMDITESDYGSNVLPVGKPGQGDTAVMSTLEEKLQVFVRSKKRSPTNLTKIENDARTLRRLGDGTDSITKSILRCPDHYGGGLSYNQVYEIVTNLSKAQPPIESHSGKQMNSYRCERCGVEVQAYSQPGLNGCSMGNSSSMICHSTPHLWRPVRH